MFDFHEKRKIRTLIYSKFSILFILLITAFLSMSVFERFSVERETAEKKEAKEAELKELKARASVLEAKVEHLENERGIEEELRNRFDVAKEGEQVVILLDDEENSNDENIEQDSEDRDPESGSFFGIFKFW